MEKPRYIEAFTQNNSPRYDWGPKKRINHYGLYAHLNTPERNDKIILNGRNTNLNQGFEEDNNSNKVVTEILTARF